MNKEEKILHYIESERNTLKCLVADKDGYLTETGELVDTLLSNIEYIISKDDFNVS